MPIKKLESDSVTSEMVVFKLLAIAGNAGRYISIDKGPIAVSSPIIRMDLNFMFEVLLSIENTAEPKTRPGTTIRDH